MKAEQLLGIFWQREFYLNIISASLGIYMQIDRRAPLVTEVFDRYGLTEEEFKNCFPASSKLEYKLEHYHSLYHSKWNT